MFRLAALSADQESQHVKACLQNGHEQRLEITFCGGENDDSQLGLKTVSDVMKLKLE